MYLFIDTETTGFPKKWNAPVTDLKNWPRMVQVAWLVYDANQELLEEQNFIIRPEGFTIPSSAVSIHHITTDIAIKEGADLTSVLTRLADTIYKVDTVVAHNISFDEKIIGAEFLRKEINNTLSEKKHICTMKSSADFCAIPGKYGNKWPKLSELYFALFGTGFSEMHNAEADIKATAQCFWELKKQGVFQ